MADEAGGQDAAGVVDPWAEADLAVALGVEPAVAAAAVSALREADLLAHGLLVAATVAAARWGVMAVDAVVDLAGGRRLHGAVSDYELRTARAEAEDDLAALGPAPAARDPWAELGLAADPVPASPHHLRRPAG